MSAGRDEGPVYYREIQKNAYLKRIPNETTSKLIPLGHKKPPLKPMWTLFCVHNGRTPFLEQYPEPESPSTLAHKPVWRACLRSARHVTCGVSPLYGSEYDFLVDTEHGPVRMLAPDWESMQDWVSTLRSKLHELKIVPRGENVYCAAPAAPAPRAAARDPTSPLPPTPPVPPDRVPGIELTTPTTRQLQTTQPQPAQPQPSATQPPTTQPQPTPPQPTQPESSEPETEQPVPTTQEPEIDISNWEPDNTPTTSQETQETESKTKTSVAKICGQNICLDDSILKRNLESRNQTSYSDEEFFAEIDRISESVENLVFEGNGESENKVDFKQRVVVSDEKGQTSAEEPSDNPTNITVIQVSNKPPHTAIPVLGSDTNVFNFDIKHPTDTCHNDTDSCHDDSFVNIVNTEVNVNSENGYGTVFTKESDYGHIHLTTTVSLTGDVKKTDNEGIYERLCLASTSNENRSPALARKIERVRNMDKLRKSSLPNLDTADNTYEYLFPNNNKNTTVTLNTEPTSLVLPREVNSNLTVTNNSSNDTQRSTNSVTRVNNDRVVNVTSVNAINTSDNRVVHPVTSMVTVTSDNRVVRSHSQNACDREREARRIQNNSPKKEVKSEKAESHPKAMWRRGLTELALLSRLRGLARRHDSPPPHRSGEGEARGRARGERRGEGARRRSSSLSNDPPPPAAPPACQLTPLRARQAAGLRAEQRRGAAAVATVSVARAPAFADYDGAVWIASWGGGGGGTAHGGRSGDRVAAVRGTPPRDAAHARHLVATSPAPLVTILFHRVPLAKMFVIPKRDLESAGLLVSSAGAVRGSAPGSPAARAGLPPPGAWLLQEANNRCLLHAANVQEECNAATMRGTEASVLLQPAALAAALRAAARRRLLVGRR